MEWETGGFEALKGIAGKWAARDGMVEESREVRPETRKKWLSRRRAALV